MIPVSKNTKYSYSGGVSLYDAAPFALGEGSALGPYTVEWCPYNKFLRLTVRYPKISLLFSHTTTVVYNPLHINLLVLLHGGSTLSQHTHTENSKIIERL
jgi:hypothetical protein